MEKNTELIFNPLHLQIKEQEKYPQRVKKVYFNNLKNGLIVN